METNPYEYNTTGQWVPQQKQYNAAGQPVGPQNRPYGNGYNNVQASQAQAPQPRKAQAPPAQQKMPKARAQALVYRFKQWIIAVSLVSFGTFSALIAFHQIDSATATTTSTSSGTSLPTATPTATATATAQSGSNFLQQGGNNVGSGSSSSSSSSTSTSTPTPTPTPVSRTHTS